MSQPSRNFQFVADQYSAHYSNGRNDQNRSSATPAPSREDSSPMPGSSLNTSSVGHSSLGTSSLGNRSSSSNGNVRWNDKITWIFLQIMLGINDPLANATDTFVKGRIWDQALVCFREQLVINYNGITAEITRFLDSRFDVKNMQDYWNKLKMKYRDLKTENGMTGIGGVNPNITWPFYDEVGQILANDRTIHPQIVMGTDINGEGPTVVTANSYTEPHVREGMSYEDKERLVEENARQRGVVHMPSREIQEKILVPARRYARLHSADSQRTSSNSLNNVTGAGRRTRRRIEREDGQDSRNNSNDSNNFDGIGTPNDIRSLINDAITRSSQNMKENIDYYHQLSMERLDRISQILDHQRRLDREEREIFFRNRNNSRS
ncbi:hypothetical protein BD770DRAFT_450100 [Pilaira anomala]|nr:hypothetical protein BD770DRAFT_450100 [Pilaira anomala]